MPSYKTKKKSKKRSRKSCPRGYIKKKSYKTKKKTYVKSKCIKDLGRSGKGPKTLPPIGKSGFLSSYGYSVDKSINSRRKALRDASTNSNALEVLRHINLIANYTAVPLNKKIMRDDVEYMKRYYARQKIRKSTKSRKSR